LSLARAVLELLAENAALKLKYDDCMADYLRRHNEATDAFLRIKELEAENAKLQRVADAAIVLIRKYADPFEMTAEDETMWRSLAALEEKKDEQATTES